jgi:hypothetical protein
MSPKANRVWLLFAWVLIHINTAMVICFTDGGTPHVLIALFQVGSDTLVEPLTFSKLAR